MSVKENTLIDLLRQVKRVLDEHSVEFWLDVGTLLGAVRDREFIPWEHDIDLGSWGSRVSENMKRSISKELCDRGFKVHIFENHMNIKKGEVHADVKFYRLRSDKAVEPKFIATNLVSKFLRLFSMMLSAPYHYEVDF